MSFTVRSLALSAWVVLLIGLALSASSAWAWPQGGAAGARPERRSFQSAGCLGQYDHIAWLKLDQVCQSCYEVYRDATVYGQCASNCFTSFYFPGCVKVLLEEENIPKYKQYIKKLHGAPIPDYS